MFFEKRVYQGSCGKVYPVPFIDKVFDEPKPVTYRSVRLENEWVRLQLLPEIGGRIQRAQDKANGDYDFFYHNAVIKPALVGLAGPWLSGGVEFNWPQHHRPGTFMPTDVFIEEETDGSRTVWMSEHDPLNRLKGMHGIRLRPGSSRIELRGRLYNRTALTQTFLWWANVAAMVHDQYQAFFPPDVNYVADHAVRAMSSFPRADGHYYGVDYGNRGTENDLSWYGNIPVPTSYMVCQTSYDFFGGYDHRAGGGFVHVADRRIAPGKKQWTWGNHVFGYAWDRELTDVSGPYIELMAGVFTDNQPDFSYLMPYETKTFSQSWWPIRGIGTVQVATDVAALHFVIRDDRRIELGLCVSQSIRDARLVILAGGSPIFSERISLSPGGFWANESLKFEGENPSELRASLILESQEVVLVFRPVAAQPPSRARSVATAPPAPEAAVTSDELYLTGEHLEQYRHPTRDPELYWLEALRRDPDDARCRIAMGRRAIRRGDSGAAIVHLERAVNRLTARHPNPVTGEAHYFLGVALMMEGRNGPASDALGKAAWSYEWRSGSHYHLACIACHDQDWARADFHLDESLATNGRHQKAVVIKAILQRHPDNDAANLMLDKLLAVDPLDHWARFERAGADTALLDRFFELCRNDAQTILDLVFDYGDAGFIDQAVRLLELHLERPVIGVAVPNPLSRSPMMRYALAWFKQDRVLLEAAQGQSPDYFFPSRFHEQRILEWALRESPGDAVAAYALGNYFYDLKRHEDAVAVWESVSGDSQHATLHRNLGIARWNKRRDAEGARACYLKAMELDPADPRLVSEYDQLRMKLNDPLEERLEFLNARRGLVLQRDDCSVALASLLNLCGRPDEALEILSNRRFHPWEGGEGSVIRQFTNAHLLQGRRALARGEGEIALHHFSKALETPENLGEAYHPLQAKADVNYWRACALKAVGRLDEAAVLFDASAAETGDFSGMAVVAHSPLSYYRGLSLRELGREGQADELFWSLKEFGEEQLLGIAGIDYFATSLPNLLVFDEDLQVMSDARAHLLIALACHGLGEAELAGGHLSLHLARTLSDPDAADLSRLLADHPVGLNLKK